MDKELENEMTIYELRNELMEPREFWNLFFSSNLDEQNLLLDITKTLSKEYQTQLANEALRES